MKKIIVIGATSGIGKGLVEFYLKKGYTVGATGRRNSLLEKLKEEYPNLYIKSFDILSFDSVEYLNELISEMGGVDIAVVSSGIGGVNPSLNWEIEDSVIQINAVGFTKMVDFLYNYFDSRDFGHLVGISSMASIRGIDISPAYCASKAYVSIYLEALRRKAVKERRYHLKISTVIPGFVDTPILDEDTPIFWKSSIEKAVCQIYSGLSRRQRVIYITRRWRFVAMAARLLPAYIQERI